MIIFKMKIDKSKRIFLHRQFADIIKKEIKQRKYKPGEYIPSERELCEKYKLSRTTVRRAISQLIDEELLFSIPGTGTFVSEFATLKDESGFKAKKSRKLGCFVKSPHSPLDSPYYSKIFRSMQEDIIRYRYSLLFHYFMAENLRELMQVIRQNELAGVILMGNISKDIILEFHKKRIPLILVDNYTDVLDITSIVPDNRKGAYEAVKYLTKLGHRRIVFLSAPLDDPVVKERFEGYKMALSEGGIAFKEEFIIPAHYYIEAGYLAMLKVLKMRPLPTAAFAINDAAAIGAMKAIREKSDLKIPKDISIVGFDDIDWASHTQPPLTTVRIHKEKTGAVSAKNIIESLQNRDYVTSKIVTPAPVIVRESCSSPPRNK